MKWAASIVLVVLIAGCVNTGKVVRVGSKNFNESYILAELFAQLLEANGIAVERKFGLGGTLVCYEALRKGEIDVYPEYTGTIAQAILDLDSPPDLTELRRRLQEESQLTVLDPLGFDNTYAIALTRTRVEELGLRTIADLAKHGDLRVALSHEFLNRNDGWPGLARAYGLTQRPSGIEHGLAYQAMAEGRIDVTDVYSTDGDIARYDLVLLDDNQGYFPDYRAVALVRGDIDAGAREALAILAGSIGPTQMRDMNSKVVLDKQTFAATARGFLVAIGALTVDTAQTTGWSRELIRRTLRHIQLTVIALLAAMLVAIPAGVVVYKQRRVARGVIYITGAMQTIPSIALLAFMIPLFGIGIVPAIVALFVYALLPILRNTAAALFSIDPVLKKVATGMGLTWRQRLRHVEFPLAAPTIMAGIKTAAVINIGTATLAAFIGAGGLGEPIVTGLALNDTGLIMEGAIPAAVLAIMTELIFEGLEKMLVPRHMQSKSNVA